MCSGGDVGGRGRGGGGAGTTLCAAAIYGRGEEMIIYVKGKLRHLDIEIVANIIKHSTSPMCFPCWIKQNFILRITENNYYQLCD